MDSRIRTNGDSIINEILNAFLLSLVAGLRNWSGRSDWRSFQARQVVVRLSHGNNRRCDDLPVLLITGERSLVAQGLYDGHNRFCCRSFFHADHGYHASPYPFWGAGGVQ